MSSFKEYMKNALEKQKELRVKSIKIENNINESSLTKYIKKSKILLEEEMADKEDEYLDDDTQDDETSDNKDDTNMNSSDEDDSEDDSADDYEKDEDEEAVNSSCPIPTQDQTVNIENRQKAIDEFGYGPEKPDEDNGDFWEEKKTKFMVKTMDLAKARVCGNCAAFSLKTDVINCLDNGIDKSIDENDVWDASTENRGYCEFLDFKCHSKRVCNSWLEGGPLKDKT